ncbi:MAG TPA: tetratricopeptide repeat protein [Thermoanaerobaculia bacterium]|nr:tetratricopeptide repeat protein [Thermoanaerobaculia bacterium]
MRLRSFFLLLCAIAAVVLAYHLTLLNGPLLAERVQITAETSVSLGRAILLVFLAGFLPAAVTLVVDTLRRELVARRERRRSREGEALDATLRRAWDLAADGQPDKAASELEVYLAARPDDFTGLVRYGSVLRRLGRTDEAVEAHRRAARLQPHSVGILYELAADYSDRDEEGLAREIRSRIVREFPGYGLEVLRRRRGEAISRREWAEASRLHEQVMALSSQGGDVSVLARESQLAQGLEYQRGVMLLEKDQPQEAAEIFRRVLHREPRFIPARIMLGEAELLAERPAEAIEAWRGGYLETGSPVFLARIEDHFIDEEEPVRAIETLRGLIAEASNDLLPRFFLGRLYYRLEMLDEAGRTLEGIGERIRSSPTFHLLQGRIHERRGEMARAVESYASCLRELEAGTSEFVCRVCGERTADWLDFCARCGSWNAVELDFEEERLSPEELGVQAVPVWAALEDSGEYGLPPVEPES